MALTSAEKQKRLRQNRLKAGLCMSCGERPPDPEKTRCGECRSKHKANSKQRNDKRKVAGLCYCGQLAVDGMASCEKHRAAAVSWHETKTAVSILTGVCKKCGEPSDEIHCPGCKVIKSAWSKKHRQKLWKQVFGHYGEKCACCGEAEPLFLTIDHVNNDGAAHRRSMPDGRYSTGERMYRWLRDNGFPYGFQTLCMNCNLGKQRNGGVCPHQRIDRLPAVPAPPGQPAVEANLADPPSGPQEVHWSEQAAEVRVPMCYVPRLVPGREGPGRSHHPGWVSQDYGRSVGLRRAIVLCRHKSTGALLKVPQGQT